MRTAPASHFEDDEKPKYIIANWSVVTRVIWAWVLTIPAAAAVGAGTWWVFSWFGWE